MKKFLNLTVFTLTLLGSLVGCDKNENKGGATYQSGDTIFEDEKHPLLYLQQQYIPLLHLRYIQYKKSCCSASVGEYYMLSTSSQAYTLFALPREYPRMFR